MKIASLFCKHCEKIKTKQFCEQTFDNDEIFEISKLLLLRACLTDKSDE